MSNERVTMSNSPKIKDKFIRAKVPLDPAVIGESERSLQERFSKHRECVTNKQLTKATGQHFNIPALVIEQVT